MIIAWIFGPWSNREIAALLWAAGAFFIFLGVVWVVVALSNDSLLSTTAWALGLLAVGAGMFAGGVVWHRRLLKEPPIRASEFR
jgi:drug/metabolite transporter (DMT)-like permease